MRNMNFYQTFKKFGKNACFNEKSDIKRKFPVKIQLVKMR